ncbi:squalene--hopene cyclase [Myxococcus sp. K15C18031901]|uniref:squalene--hopene cyclase n=1 Tax=Myxococcus dinghuensis TaxID=2906761 RepID=UPI0020A82E1A|nr:squalene--hopene cyclase [Myxococcus dinghuensis]MCP3101656.1 squalene--hopene cyclase [Myxococcus dinghuensis]
MATSDPRTLEASAEAALGFLLEAQDARGAWTDFMLPATQSDVWVSGFVGTVLAGLVEPAARRAAEAAWRYLEGVDGQGGGWSYNAWVPGDADSTLWGLRLAEALGTGDSARARLAGDFLARHLREDGGLATYASDEDVRDYIGLPPEVSFQGWTHSHVCVSAAGANLSTHRARLGAFLLRTQDARGHWPAYWWFDEEYSTAEAVAALTGVADAVASPSERAARLERAAAWALERVARHVEFEGPRPPSFALAQALRVVARARPSPRRLEALLGGVSRLCAWQTPRGCWSPSARLRVPRPDVVVPEPSAPWTLWRGAPPDISSVEDILRHTFTNYSLDLHAVFTTATVLRALNEVRALLLGPGSPWTRTS